MTEYEVLDLISTYRSEGGYHVMNFAAAMFGYVAAAYFVGRKLTKAQTAAITFLFCLFVPGPMAASYEAVQSMSFLVTAYGDTFESIASSTGGVAVIAPVIVPGTILAAWLVSMVFMYQIRKD